jgi:hypothetical protein
LLFRELQTQYELDEFDTSNPDVVEILLYAPLLSLMVSCDLLDLATEQTDDEIVFLPERWAATFRSNAQLPSTNSASTSITRHRRNWNDGSKGYRGSTRNNRACKRHLLPLRNRVVCLI